MKIKNVFAESFFIQKTFIVENAFKQIKKEAVSIDKNYTSFYKIYKITFGQINIKFKRLPRYIPIIAIFSLMKYRFDFYKKQIGNDKIINLSIEKPVRLFGEELDAKFLETYKTELILAENSVALSEYVNNKENLEQKFKDTYPTLIQFYDECMLSDLRFLLFTFALSFASFTVSFIYFFKKKRNTWKRSLFNSMLFYYILREALEYSHILQYIQFQDQISRFILTKGDPNIEDVDEMLKYGFFRKNLNKI